MNQLAGIVKIIFAELFAPEMIYPVKFTGMFIDAQSYNV